MTKDIGKAMEVRVGAGRPRKLTVEKMEEIVGKVLAGNFANIAAVSSGISEGGFHHWMKLGREVTARLENYEINREPLVEKELIYMDCARGSETARAMAEVKYLNVIETASMEDWRAAAFWLERVHAGRFARQQRLETTVKGDPDNPIQVEVSAKDMLVERLSAIAERRTAGEALMPARDDEVTIEEAEIDDG
jgi:hypothetical protein